MNPGVELPNIPGVDKSIINFLYNADPITGRLTGIAKTSYFAGAYSFDIGIYNLKAFDFTTTNFYLINSTLTMAKLNLFLNNASDNHAFISFGDISFSIGGGTDGWKYGFDLTAASVGYNAQNFEMAFQVGSIGLGVDWNKKTRILTINISFIFGIKIRIRL